MTGLADLLALSQSGLAGLGVIFLRVGTATLFLPGLGEQSIPARVRLMIGFAMTVIVFSAQPPGIAPTDSAATWAVGLAELSVGALLGISVRFALFALQTAGSIAAQSTSLAQLLGNAGADPMPAIGHVLTLGGLALLMAQGFPTLAARYLITSYDAFPLGQWPLAADVGEWSVRLTGQSFALSFQLAAPFFIVSLLYNLALGAINRAMPQLMVAFVGAPFITWAALALLLLTSASILLIWSGHVTGTMRDILGVAP